MNYNIRSSFQNIRKILIFVLIICIFCIIIDISTISIIKTKNSSKYNCLICAIDLIICVGGGRFLNLIILPLGVLLFYISCSSEEFNYNYFTRMKSRKNIGLSICLKLLAISALMTVISYICVTICSICMSDKFNSLNMPNSLINTELYYTSTSLGNNYNTSFFIIKEIIISFLEVYARSMIGILLYAMFNKMFLSVLIVLGTSYLIPFRMAAYMRESGFDLTYGTFYTELINTSMYFKSVLIPVIYLLATYLLIIIILQRKNYL